MLNNQSIFFSQFLAILMEFTEIYHTLEIFQRLYTYIHIKVVLIMRFINYIYTRPKIVLKTTNIKLSNYQSLLNTFLDKFNFDCLKEKFFIKLNSFMRKEQSKNIIQLHFSILTHALHLFSSNKCYHYNRKVYLQIFGFLLYSLKISKWKKTLNAQACWNHKPLLDTKK